MFRLHDWRALRVLVNGTAPRKAMLHRLLTRWRKGRAPNGLQVFAVEQAPLVPLESPAQVVWDGWPGNTPRRRPSAPESTLELVPLLLSDREAEALRRHAVDRGVSVAELVGEFVQQLERDLEQPEEREVG